ncbi:MAG: hypothetical protein KBT11_06055 [Treponema sp.]|nr:hypothetical protein [Candidatus Treponema equifaecale]
MMKKTFIPGNKQSNQDSAGCGFGLLLGIMILLLISVLAVGALCLERVRLEKSQKLSERFYLRLSEENSELEKLWKENEK